MLKIIQWLPLMIKPKLAPLTYKAYLTFFLLPLQFHLIPAFKLNHYIYWFAFRFFNMPNSFLPQISYILASTLPSAQNIFLLDFHIPFISTL